MMKHSERSERYDEPKDKHSGIRVANAILSLNAQDYSAPVSSSNSTQRTLAINLPFNPQSYQNVNGSTNASIILNTGSALLNPSTSSVIFDISFTGAADTLAWSFGGAVNSLTAGYKSGSSACNLFEEVTLFLRGGEVPYRTISANVLNASITGFKKGVGYENMLGECLGANDDKFPLYYCNGTTVSVEIPLSKLFIGMFDSHRPLPPTVISGAKINLKFAAVVQAMCFYTVAAKPQGWAGQSPVGVPTPVEFPQSTVSLNINNMNLMVDTMDCFDSSMQLINSKAASLQSSGLQYPLQGFWSIRTVLNTSSANIDLLLSSAQLQSVYVAFCKPLNLANGTYDAMARLPLWSYGGALGSSVFQMDANSINKLGRGSASARIRIGSSYTTLSPIQSAGMAYRLAYQSMTDTPGGLVADIDALHCVNRPLDIAVSYKDYVDPNSGAFVLGWDLSRSAVVGLSGQSVNNSRNVILELTNLNAGAGANEQIECFIFAKMVRVINSSLENNIVDQ
jgi:hypothetical protein